MPSRTSIEDYFARLEPVQRPHLEALRALSRSVAPMAREELKWNLPTYVVDRNTSLWMLQNFTKHCSLRFTPEFFGAHAARVTEAGWPAGAGFVKLPYDRELPTDLLTELMRARLVDCGAEPRP